MTTTLTRGQIMLLLPDADVDPAAVNRALAVADIPTTRVIGQRPVLFTVQVTEEWGVALLRKDGSTYLVRWDPTYGGRREQVAYTEAEARADAARPDRDGYGKKVVKRTRTSIEIEDVETPWEEA